MCQGIRLRPGQISILRHSHVRRLVCPPFPSPNSLPIDIRFVTVGARECALTTVEKFFDQERRSPSQAKLHGECARLHGDYALVFDISLSAWLHTTVTSLGDCSNALSVQAPASYLFSIIAISRCGTRASPRPSTRKLPRSRSLANTYIKASSSVDTHRSSPRSFLHSYHHDV